MLFNKYKNFNKNYFQVILEEMCFLEKIMLESFDT